MLADSTNLFSRTVALRLPERVATFGRLDGNLIKRLADPARDRTVVATKLANGRGFRCDSPDGFSFAIVAYGATGLQGCDAVLRVADASSIETIETELAAGGGTWILPRPMKPESLTAEDVAAQVAAATASWLDRFEIRDERYEGDTLIRSGLRPPQVGAIYATKAHWSVSTKAATIVLPTGTGKTETMLALLVSERITRVLVVVPSDALRTQIAEKFIGLGVLKQSGCLYAEAQHPSVAVLKKAPRDADGVDRLVGGAHVIVATMQALAGMPGPLQARLASKITHLFVDEAHHIAARTWRDFKLQLSAKPVLQFTATPFRRDGKRVDGRFIYVYPLRRAQEDQLFKPIQYVPVQGLSEDDADQKIIRRVGETLAADEAKGLSHLAMARTRSVARAETLHAEYARFLPQHTPQLIHSQMPASERIAALRKLRMGDARIIVCVDMLGEGFDLPELKVAALHDKHRSEAITLQFVGRFTRTRQDLGDATVIANVAVDELNDRLRALYAEDADWNHLLSVVGHARTERERRREDVFAGFDEMPEEFPLETFEPRLSTVAYRTHCTEWRPENVIQAIESGSTIVEGPFLNAEARLLVFVTRDEERLRWTSVKSPRNVEYNMVMAHWDADQNLLFINSSRLGDLHTGLARALSGDDAERIAGEDVFRVLYGFRRLVLMNLGLSETQRKPVRYSMFMGSDIAEPLDTLPGNRSRTKTNLFGQGFIDVEDLDENGNVVGKWPQKATIGCSTKGKLWSYQTTNSLAEWVEWCQALGRRLLNDSITPDLILRNVVRPKKQTALPAGKVPIAIAWPERFLFDSEERIEIEVGGATLPFFNCAIDIMQFVSDDAIHFHVGGEDAGADFELRIGAGGADYRQVAGNPVIVHRARKQTALIDLFREDPPHVYFADGDMLVASELFVLRRDEALAPFALAKIEALNWTGVDITKESQGLTKRPDSIQRHVIKRVLESGVAHDVVFDDDGKGEIADVVAIRREGHSLHVELYHCKYSSQNTPGARVDDLYELCGQAQKSIRWAERLDEFLQYMRRRETDRLRASKPSRFERGDLSGVLSLLNHWRELKGEFSVTLVQPGYSKAAATLPQLELFAATESFLMDTWRMPLAVWASA